MKAFLQAAGLAKWDAAAQDDNRNAQVLPDVWDLHIVGDGPERGVIEQLIALAGPQAAARIHLLGYKDGKELHSEVGNARFTVLSSEWRENMPYSGLESLADQTPIIGAGIGGIPELVVEGETGFGFESGNADDLAEILTKAGQVNVSIYQTMQQACSEYVNERCNQNTYVGHLGKLYAGLLNRGRK